MGKVCFVSYPFVLKLFFTFLQMKFLSVIRKILLGPGKVPSDRHYFRIRAQQRGPGTVWPMTGTVMVNFSQGEKIHILWNVIQKIQLYPIWCKLTISTKSNRKLPLYFVSRVEMKGFVKFCLRNHLIRTQSSDSLFTFTPTVYAIETRPPLSILRQFLNS